MCLQQWFGKTSYKECIVEPSPIIHQPSKFVTSEDYPQAIESIHNSVVVPFIFISNNHDYTYAYMHTLDPYKATLQKWIQELLTGGMKYGLSGHDTPELINIEVWLL